MTAQARPGNAKPWMLELVCDRCGLTLDDLDLPLRDWYVLWPIVMDGGWRGPDHPFGPHYCPSCA